MRVHLRGVVIAVAVLLSLVVVVSVFNAYDSKPARGRSGRMAGRPNQNAGTEEEATEDGAPRGRKLGTSLKARSRNSPRSSLRLTDTRAGGPRAPGVGARPGGPRPGGPRGPGARAAEGEEGAEDRPLPRGRLGGPGPRARMQQEDTEDSEDEETSETTRPRPGLRARGPGARVGGPGAGAGAGVAGRAADVLENVAGPRKRGRRKVESGEDEDEEEEGEEATRRPKRKKEPTYPDWWKTSYARSAVYGMESEFVGDQPLFPECPVFDKSESKVQRFGYVDPQNYMANSKNPCWFEFNGKKDMLKCVPYFYVAGVAKSGTADLLNRVRNHPQVMTGSTIAYHWWDRLRYGAPTALKYTKEARRTLDPVPLKEYAKMIVESGGKNVTRGLLYNGQSQVVFGDGTPTYFVENTQWTVFEGNQGCNEPRILPASFIRHMFPESHIVLLLRHPVVRLYSRFLANIPNVPEFENRTSTLFHTFCVQAVQIYHECFARASIRQCAYNASLFSNAVVRLSEGMYPIFLEDWYRIFPKEQILVMRYEDYITDIPDNVAKVFSFLELEPLDPYAMMKISEVPLIRKGMTPEQVGHMLPETVHLLNEFYAPFLARLAYMLDDEKWLFDDVTIMTSQIVFSGEPTPYVPPGHRAIGGQTMPTQTDSPPKGGQAQADLDAKKGNPDDADEDGEGTTLDEDEEDEEEDETYVEEEDDGDSDV